MSTAEIVTEANITCPTCNFTEQADMPTDI